MRTYFFNEKVSLKPNLVTIFNDVCYADNNSGEIFSIHKGQHRSPVVKQFHNFQISAAAKKTIQEKVQWLYLLGKSRYQKSYSGKEIFNFKINFLTLTLPSVQQHSTSQITQDCFNQFLTEIRQRTGMENYVWRLEFQKNKNVHYHIVTDTYIDYFLAQKIWNRIINKLGYVDVYSQKFSAMTLSQYVESQSAVGSVPFDVLAKRYAKGKQVLWREPHSVDVKVCTSAASIGYYISKYFSKTESGTSLHNPLDNEQNSFGLRLWFCSRSLSKLKSITNFTASADVNWFALLQSVPKVRLVVCEYASCLFFELRQLTNEVKALLYPVYRKYANSLGYSSA